MSRADALGTLIEKLTSSDINLSPAPVLNADSSVRHPGLDNHGMGSMFEELVRRFNEENNEEAGEHWTPRDAVRLMAKLVFLPVAEEIKSGTYLLYDGACGTGGMLTVAEDTLRQLAAECQRHGEMSRFQHDKELLAGWLPRSREATKSVGQSGSSRFSFNRSGLGLQPDTTARTSPQRTVKGSRPDLQHEIRPTVFGALRCIFPRSCLRSSPRNPSTHKGDHMTKKDLIDQVTSSSGVSLSKKDTETLLEATFNAIGQAVCKEKRFAYPGFGTFTLRERTARKGRNPQTGAIIKIKASKTIAFKPTSSLKDSL